MIRLYISFLLFVTIFSVTIGQNYETTYYAVSYANNSLANDILFSKINIDNRTIDYSVKIPIRGQIQFKKPIIFKSNSNQYFFITTFNGLSGKNSVLLNEPYSGYAMIDEHQRIIAQNKIPNIQLTGFSQVNNLTAIVEYIDSVGANMEGILDLTDFNHPVVTPIRRLTYDNSEYPVIAGFQYFKRIKKSDNKIYWCTMMNGVYLLALDIANNKLLDSLNIEVPTPYTYLMVLSNNDSLVYVFYMNYNEVSGPPSMIKTNIDTSYVKIYRTSNFSLTDSLKVEYPPADSEYFMGMTGPADNVGPYFVYFDMAGEGIEFYSPAMLFIFDTRTNEASWLRVGWR